jgi:hypothetical protein
MLSEKLLPSKHESLDGIVGPSGPPIALLVKTATGATLFALATLSPTSSYAVMPAMQLATTNLGFIGEQGLRSLRGFVPFKLIMSDRTRSDTAIKILQKLDVIEKANPSMASQIADARKFASALPSGLTVPRAWTDGESEVVLEWINGEKHAIVSFEGDGEFGYAMRQGDRFAPGSSPNNVEVAALDDLIDYLAHL